MSVHSSIGPERRRTLTSYVLLYVVAAAMAVAYLVYIGAQPDLVASWRDNSGETQTALVEAQRSVERVLADVDPLKQGLGEMKMEVATIKANVDEGAQRDRILLDKVEALERTTAQVSEKIAEAAAATPAPKKQAVAKAPAPVEKSAAIETGSIEQKKAAAPVKPAPVGVLLATGPSLDALRLSWTILNDRHADAVRALHARYVVNGKDNERTYGLVAGPLETVADAKAVCKTIVERGMACEVSQFRGNTF
ncbi:MAG TPA: hypothetical protein VNR51_00520 [Hyphomicrobium sp.]|nr:hypothetical protein [Hyphomicrobium sp.]